MTRLVVPAMVLALAVPAVVMTGCKGGDTTASAPTSAPAPEPTEATDHGATSEYTYVCPMHPEEVSDNPAKCGVCGMYMEADTDEEVEYHCPMHPEVLQETPGECDPCGGMILIARTKS